MQINRAHYLLYLISLQNDYVTAERIAEEAGVSLRTVSSFMPEAKKLANENGSHILVKKGKGYKLEIDDPVLFEKLKLQLEVSYNYTGKAEIQGNEQSLDVLTQIISGRKFFSLNEIANAMFFSRGMAFSVVHEAEEIISSYNLKLRNNASGYYIEGSELNKRMFLTQNITPKEEIRKYIEMDRYGQIRNSLLKQLVKYDVKLQDEITRIVVEYILISQTRLKYGFGVELDQRIEKEIKSCKEYELVKNALIQCKSPLISKEAEIAAFALIILISKDNYGNISQYPFIKSEYELCRKRFFELLEQSNFPIAQIENDVEKIISESLIYISLLNHFNISTFRNINEIRLQQRIESSYMSMLFAEQFCNEVCLNSKKSAIVHLAKNIDITLRDIHYNPKKIKIAVVSKEGYAVATSIKELVQQRYFNHIEKIEALELYEMREYEKNDLDCIIMNFSDALYRYQWDYVSIDYPINKHGLEVLKLFLLSKSLDLDTIVKNSGLEGNFYIHNNCEFKDIYQLIEAIHDKWADDDSMKEYLQESLWRSVVQNMVMLFIPSAMVKHPFMEYYNIKRMSKINNRKIQHVFVVSVDFKKDPSLTKFVFDLIPAIIQDPKKLVGNDLREYAIQSVRKRLLNDRLY